MEAVMLDYKLLSLRYSPQQNEALEAIDDWRSDGYRPWFYLAG
jgi:hypothetical protein